MQIKELSEKTALSRDTIRFYEKEELIAPPVRGINGYRHYNEQVISQLQMINAAKTLGFTLREIKELGKLLYSNELTKGEMAKQLELKNSEIDHKIMELQNIKHEIDKALKGLCEHKKHLR